MRRVLFFPFLLLLFLADPAFAQPPETPPLEPGTKNLPGNAAPDSPQLEEPPPPEEQPVPPPEPQVAVEPPSILKPRGNPILAYARTGWIHELGAGISWIQKDGGGAHYSVLYRPSLLYSFGGHAAFASTNFSSRETDLETRVLHIAAAAEGRVYLVNGNMDVWLSALMGAAFFTETESTSDAINADGGLMAGGGIGIALFLARHVAWGAQFSAYRIIPLGTIDEELKEYYTLMALHIFVSLHF